MHRSRIGLPNLAPPAEPTGAVKVRSLGSRIRRLLTRGAVIPTMMSIYLLAKNRLWVNAALATAAVAVVCYWLSRPMPGLGIAEPVFVPSVTTAIVALLLSRVLMKPKPRPERASIISIWIAIPRQGSFWQVMA